MAIDDREPSTGDTTNELKAIKGIGPSFARALNKLGVMGLADLVRYTPEELSKALAEEAETKVASERIAGEDWIGQAQRLLEEKSGADVEDARSGEPADAPEGVGKEEEQRAWRQEAGFSLFFDYVTDDQGNRVWQTRVYHEESGAEPEFPGTTEWVNWVLERAGLSGAEGGQPDVPEPGDAEEPRDEEHAHRQETEATPLDAAVEILDVHVTGVDAPDAAGGKRLLTEVYFQVAGSEASALSAQRLPYRVEVRAIDVETGEPAYIEAASDNLPPDILQGKARLELPLPQLGRYALHSVVHLLPPADVQAFYEGPTVRIVAGG